MNKGQGKQKNQFAVELGRLGGLKTASRMTKEQKVERAKKAVRARLGRKEVEVKFS